MGVKLRLLTKFNTTIATLVVLAAFWVHSLIIILKTKKLNAMKKYIGLLLAAIIGGASSTLLNSYLNKAENTQISQNKKDVIHQDVTFVNNHRIAAEKSVDFTYAAEMSINAVVHVKTTGITRSNDYYYWDPFREFFYGNRGQQRHNIQQYSSTGSGVIISTDGFIVTNNHVVKDAEKIEITLNDGQSFDAEIIGLDPTTDLALLKISGSDFPFIPYGNSENAKIGEWVLAVGNPFNLTSTVTAGIISAKGRDINILDNNNVGLPAVESFIQTDAAVNPGNSGGALVATTGELLGINTAIKSNTGSYAGYSFAIPVNIVKKVVDDLLEFGEVQRAFIGVSIRNIDSELAKEKNISNYKGVYISDLMDGGSGKNAGLKAGDIITKIGNINVTNVPELQEQVSKFRPGDQLIATVVRDNVEKEFTLTLTNKFGNTDLVKKENKEISRALGAEFAEITADEKSKLKINTGVKITNINGGKLRSVGIQEGFIITKVDKKPVNNFDELVQLLNGKKGGVLIEGVYPNGMKAYYGFGM